MDVWHAVGSGARYVLNRGANSISLGLDVTGSLASVLAGVSNACSFALQETLLAAYYVEGNATIEGEFNGTMLKGDYSIVQSENFTKYGDSTGSFQYELDDDIKAFNLQMAALGLLLLGMLLKSAGQTLKIYTQRFQYSESDGNNTAASIPLPSWQEYGFNIGKGVTSALVLGFGTNAIVQSILKYSNLVDHLYQFTYPFFSDKEKHLPDYTVPLEGKNFSEGYEHISNASIDVGPLDIPIQEKIDVNVTGSGVFGAGVFINNKGVDGKMIGPAIAAASVSYAAYSIFSERADKARENRYLKASQFMHADEQSPLIQQV